MINKEQFTYDKYALLTLRIKEARKLTFRSMNGTYSMVLKYPLSPEDEVAKLWGPWLIECRANVVYIRQMDISGQKGAIEEETIEIELDNGNNALQIETPLALSFYRVFQLMICPDHTEVFQNVDNEELTDALQHAADLEIELVKEQKKNTDLQKLLKEKITAALLEKQRENQRLSDENKIEAGKLEKAEEEKVDIQKKMQEMKGLEEALQLQKQEAEAYLTQIRQQAEQFSLDAETMHFLTDGTSLQNNSVIQTMDQIWKEMEAVEKRLCTILKMKEQMEKDIAEALIHGDGKVMVQP